MEYWHLETTKGMILQGFCSRADLNEWKKKKKALCDDWTTAFKKIDCIIFAKLSLYSVNMAPLLTSYCKKKKETE